MTFAIQAEQLGKSYLIGHRRREPYQTLRESLAQGVRSAWNRLRHPNLSAGGDDIEEFWALRDVSFEIQPGDRVGIIGRNGAGKSTLLKILSRITEPTTGRFVTRGRVASLLEVGTGFHPELSGRENIYLNGAILGMTRNDVKRQFDAIVDFAGVEKFLDTPVKRYSSGMYVRLAFAVAAHLEPDILIVDEVLAVGDAEFQKKCLGKMEEVGKEGRTVVFVSHNMGAIRRLCDKGMVVDGGRVNGGLLIEHAIKAYSSKSTLDFFKPIEKGNKPISIESVQLCSKQGNRQTSFNLNEDIIVILDFNVLNIEPNQNVAIQISQDSTLIWQSWDVDNKPSLLSNRKTGKFNSIITIPNFFSEGVYNITVACGQIGVGPYQVYNDCMQFQIVSEQNSTHYTSINRKSLLRFQPEWQTREV